jgi:predicted DNA-binding transcriptional regulator AlpA
VPRWALRLDELEASLGISKRLIQKEVSAGRFPRPIKIGRTSVWPVQALREHLAQQADGRRPKQ